MVKWGIALKLSLRAYEYLVLLCRLCYTESSCVMWLLFPPPFLFGPVRGRALNFLVTLNGIALEAGRDTPAHATTVCMYCAGGKRECLANRHKVNESTHRRRGRKVGGRQALVLQAVSTRNQVIQPRRG